MWNILLKKISDKKGRDLAAARFARSASELKVSERTRLATELHDSIVQNMTGAAMKLRAADKLFESNPAESRRQLALALRTLDSSRDEIRNCIWDLRNQALEKSNIDEAIRITLQPHIADAQLHVRFNMPRRTIPDNAFHNILCIIRELVVNAVRHGHATTLKIAGTINGGRLLFFVADNGSGFDPATRPGMEQGHFGLEGVMERVKALDGMADIASAPGKGTRITINIPLPEEA